MAVSGAKAYENDYNMLEQVGTEIIGFHFFLVMPPNCLYERE
jgi:hypothetical protein